MRSVGLSFVAPIELMSDGITADAGFIRVGAPGLGRRVSYCSPAKQRRDHDRFVTWNAQRNSLPKSAGGLEGVTSFVSPLKETLLRDHSSFGAVFSKWKSHGKG